MNNNVISMIVDALPKRVDGVIDWTALLTHVDVGDTIEIEGCGPTMMQRARDAIKHRREKYNEQWIGKKVSDTRMTLKRTS